MTQRSQPINEHTPTPWAVDPDHRPGMGWNTHVVEASDPNNRVCFMTSGPEGKINAAFIVEAVNNYASLKARVAELEAECNRWAEASIAEDYRRVEWRKALLEIEQTTIDHVAVKIARAALSHAGPVARDGER